MRVTGVKKVDVNFEEKTATVAAASCDPVPMLAELARAGYKGAVR
jgi:hypothetical protein